jgi:hypothetical protein
MRVVIWQDKDGYWYYVADTLVRQLPDQDLKWELHYAEDNCKDAKIVEIPDLPNPNTLA